MRKINEIFIHCSATPPNRDIQAEDIRTWHVRDNGWSDIGYHWVITRKGELQKGRPVRRPGAHARGHNSYSLGICMVGGINTKQEAESNYTEAQWDMLRQVIVRLMESYPDAKVRGHNEVAAKACPSFDVHEWLQQEGLA